MALPDDLSRVRTNLTPERLEQVLRAIDADQAAQVPGSSSMYAGSAACRFAYQGVQYAYEESFEVCTGLYEVNEAFLRSRKNQLSLVQGVIAARRAAGRSCD